MADIMNNSGSSEIRRLAAMCVESSTINPQLFTDYHVYRGLRAPDGSGVLTGLTDVADVMANKTENGKFVPCAGEL